MAREILLPNVDAPDAAVSAFELRRLAEGDLAAPRDAEVRALIANDAALKERFEQIEGDVRAEKAAFAIEVPYVRFVSDHEARTRSALSVWFAKIAQVRVLGALAATAAVVFLFVRAPGDDVDPYTATYDGLKGGARIGFFVKPATKENGAHVGIAGEPLRAGDAIQFAVRDDDAKGVMVIVGVDGRGNVSVYAQEDLTGMRAKGPTQEHTRVLENSVVLDDATGAERFFVVYADGDVDAVTAAVERAAKDLAGRKLEDAARLPLDETYVQSSVHIVKVR